MNTTLPKTWTLLLALLIQTSVCASEVKSGLAKHPLFELLTGKWNSEGILKAPDGREVKIKEEWAGEAVGDGSFVMKGRRLIDGDRQEYVWTFTLNPTSGLIEARHDVAGDADEPKRFEVSISDVDLTMELKYSGENLSSISVKDTFDDGTKDKLKSEVVLTGSSGETTLSGTLKHTRVKKP